MGTFPNRSASHAVAVPSRPSPKLTAIAVEVGVGDAVTATPLAMVGVGSLLMDASRSPAAPGGTGAPSQFRVLPPKCWHLPEGAHGNGDGMKDVNSRRTPCPGPTTSAASVRDPDAVHLKTLWVTGPGVMHQKSLRAGALRFSLGLRPALDPPAGCAVAPSDPIAHFATFVAATGS